MRALAFLPLLALAGCPGPSPYPDLSAVLGAGWRIVPLPNTKLNPGAIVQLTPVGAPTIADAKTVDLLWLGMLQDCGVPASALAVEGGAVPAITSGRSYSIGTNVAAALTGIGPSIAANATRTTQLRIDQASDVSVNLINLDTWLANPANMQALQFSPCGHFLAQPNVYTIEEAFIVFKGSYAFTDAAGATLAVTPAPGVPVTVSGSVSGGANESLQIDQPIVFAIRNMRPFSGGFAPVATATASGREEAPAPAATSPLAGKALGQVRIPFP